MNNENQLKTKVNEGPAKESILIPSQVVANTPTTFKKDESINLIPTLSKEEVVKEEKKKNLNVGSIVSLLILVVVSILIVGFNIFSKVELNQEKKVLQGDENNMMSSSDKITSSNEISARAVLYQDILGQSYSPKQVIDYLNAIAARSGTAYITKLTLGDSLSFEMDGQASNLNDVSKFWYLLSNDSKVGKVTLKSVGNNTTGSQFSFEGKLVLNDFLSSTN
jgi:hypothetical protein